VGAYLPFPQTLLPIAQQRRHQIFNQSSRPCFNLHSDRHTRREIDHLVFDLHLGSIERNTSGVKQFLPVGLARIRQSAARTRRSVREYLDTLDEAAWGAASETVPKFISKLDPAAQWTGAHKGHAFFAYADNYLIDPKAAIIVDVEATRAIRQAEVGAARTMIERTEDCLGLRGTQRRYFSAAM